MNVIWYGIVLLKVSKLLLPGKYFWIDNIASICLALHQILSNTVKFLLICIKTTLLCSPHLGQPHISAHEKIHSLEDKHLPCPMIDLELRSM
jgi:hypothetical protein